MSAGLALELDDIQGNVLHGYGMPYAAYVNLRIEDAAAGRRLLGALRPDVTPATRWDEKPKCTLNVAISHAGLEALGVSQGDLDSFPDEFAEGMEARAEDLGDENGSAPPCWHDAMRDIQVLASIHATSPKARGKRLDALLNLVRAHSGVTPGDSELADDVDDDRHNVREHFGFADGFGQPGVAGQPGLDYPGQGVPVEIRKGLLRRKHPGWRLIAPGEFILGYRDEDGVLPEAPVHPYGRNGTFMVFRKLEQDVEAFHTLLRDLADRHFDGDRERAAAKIVGRWDDGTPVMLSPDRKHPDVAQNKWWTNDFRYAADAQGHVCPIGAHIRRANPRDSLAGGGNRTRRHRIIRRGMPYGSRYSAATSSQKRGLYFVCFNASIARQFEVVNSWLLHGDVFGLDDGDLLTDGLGTAAMTVQGDPPALMTGSPGGRPLVTTRGGEYLFLPGLRALDAIAAGRRP